MADDKEIRIRAVLDASTFDKGVNEIQEKLKKLTQQQSQGATAQKTLGKDSVLGKYAQQAFGDFSKESQKQLEQMYQTQRREAVNQSITLKGKEAELAKIAKMDAEMTKQQRERNENLKKEIELLKEKQRVTLNTAAETQRALDKMGGGNGNGGGGANAGGGNTGGGGGSEEPNGQFKKFLEKITLAAGAAAIYNGAMNGISDVITRDRKIGANNAASFGMGSREMREQFAGQGSRGQFWMPERARAMERARTEGNRQRYADFLPESAGSAVTGLAAGYAGMVAGGVAGTYGGAAIGGMFGGIGAIPGAVIGAGIGAVGGAAMGIYGSMGERGRARYFDQKKYNSIKNKEDLENYEQNLAAEKAANPRKEMARDYFEQNGNDLMQMQKLTGSSTDREMLAGDNVGLLQRNMKYGGQYGGANFSQQTIQEQMQALASGGAMTSGIRDMGGAAATYNRQFNLSNAGQTMGRMQGNTGMNSSLTEMAYQRLMTEAVKLGVDASTMPRELEKMTQITAELTTSGGVNATGMADLFGAGITGFDQKSMSAAAGATQNFQSTAKEAGGWEAQMGMGYLQGDEAKKLLGGKKLSAQQMNSLNQTSAAELGDEGIARMASAYDMDPADMKKLLQGKDKYKQGRSGQEDQTYQQLGDFLKGKSPEEAMAAIQSGPGAKLYQAAVDARGAGHGDFLQKDQKTQMSEIMLQSNVANGNAPSKPLDIAAAEVAAQKSKTENRSGYVEEGSKATGDMARMSTVLEYAEEFKKAAKANTAAAEEYNKQFELLLNATKKGAGAMDAIADHLNQLATQSGAGSVPGGKVPYGSAGGH